MDLRTEIENIVHEILMKGVTKEDAVKELLDLFNVSYSVFDHETIERIRNSVSDAEVRRMIKTKIKNGNVKCKF